MLIVICLSILKWQFYYVLYELYSHVFPQQSVTWEVYSKEFRLPRWLSDKNPPANAGDAGDMSSVPRQEDPLEKGMATHASIIAWEIPWTEEPGGL